MKYPYLAAMSIVLLIGCQSVQGPASEESQSSRPESRTEEKRTDETIKTQESGSQQSLNGSYFGGD